MRDAVTVSDLRVERGGRVVLPGISTAVRAGCVTGLLGPSGSGKTTLMRAIVGVQLIESGRIEVLGLPAGARELRERVAYVTQSPSVYGDLTVRENVAYFARVLGVERERVEGVIETVGLAGEADRLVRRLSGGQRSRA